MKARIVNISHIEEKDNRLVMPFSPGNLAMTVCKQVGIPLTSLCRLYLGDTDSIESEEYYQEEDGIDGNTCYDHLIIYSKGKTIEQYAFVVDKGIKANLIYAMIVDNKEGETEIIHIDNQSEYLRVITDEDFRTIITQGIQDKIFTPEVKSVVNYNNLKESLIKHFGNK